MGHDEVSSGLDRHAPVALPAVIEAIGRFESLPLTELQPRADAASARFRAWSEDPGNAGRPFTDCPDYIERIALESLLERRLFTE